MQSQGLNTTMCITNALLVDRTHTAFYMETPENFCWVDSWDKKMSQYNYISQLEKAEGYNWWADEGKSLVSLAFAPQQGSSSQCSSEGKTQNKVYWGCGILKTWGCYWDWVRTTAATRRRWGREEFDCSNPAPLLRLKVRNAYTACKNAVKVASSGRHAASWEILSSVMCSFTYLYI